MHLQCVFLVMIMMIMRMMRMMMLMTIKEMVMVTVGDGQQLPWESNLLTCCGPGEDQVETRRDGPKLGPPLAWSPLGLHQVCTWTSNLIPPAGSDHHHRS